MSDTYKLLNDVPSILEDAFSTYLAIDKSSNSIISKTSSISPLFTNKMQIVEAIRKGINYSFFKVIQSLAPFTETDWAEFLDVSTKTLQRYKKSESHVFKSIHSEKIIELAEVTAIGLEVFETKQKFQKWLNTPSYALGKLKPTELLKNSYGKELVIDELHRIDHGIFA